MVLRVPPARTGPTRRRSAAVVGAGHANARGEHPVETLQRTIGNRATTVLIQRRGSSTAPRALAPDASQEELHAEYVRGREMYDLGLFDEAVAVWTPVYAHPMTRGNTSKRSKLALIIGRANHHAGHASEAISWYQEVIATPGVEADEVARARTLMVAARRDSDAEAGLPSVEPLPADAGQDQLYAAYLEGRGLYLAGLYDAAAAKLLTVYEHPNVGVDKQDDLAVLIGNTHFHAHRFDHAISWFQQAIETEGADAEIVERARDGIVRCRRGSTEQAGTAVAPPLAPDASSEDLYRRYLEGDGLYRAGLFAEAIGVWVPVYEHPNVGDERRARLGFRIGIAHHHQSQFRPAMSWYTETLVRGGLSDTEAVDVHRRLAQARHRRPATPMVPPDRPTISRGWRGRHVRHLQECLKAYGFHLKVDGIFGGETARQVRTFQTANGLTPDGIVGPRSWYVLS